MSDAYRRYSDSRQTADLLSHLPKRPRSDNAMPSGQGMSSYYIREDGRAGLSFTRGFDSNDASYDRNLTAQILSNLGESRHATESSRGEQHIDDPRTMALAGSDPTMAARSQSVGEPTRPEIPLPPDASSTLFVECLPANCTRREVSRYKELRLVTKESRHPRDETLVLCFVDFQSPAHAASAMDALQGYKFDEQDGDSARLRLQFARHPGARSGGGHRERH